MATVLFITRKQLVQNSIIDGNVDTDKFIQFIKIAQEIHIRNYLGTDLYNKISNDIAGVGGATLTGAYLTLVTTYIQPMLIHFAIRKSTSFFDTVSAFSLVCLNTPPFLIWYAANGK